MSKLLKNWNKDDAPQMTSQLRIVAGKPKVILSGEVECDEVYVAAGHKGNPEAEKKKVVRGRQKPPQRGFGAGHYMGRKNNRFSVIHIERRGLIDRNGNVQQTTIAPLIKQPSFLEVRSIPMVRHLHPLLKVGL